ncbi:hypothetical protein HYW82_00715 [Candidatus Peregrinibacteria bacterium]|nr:hypothetical protein [Candidatus Peregrinibacteria bacterium]
MSYLKKMEEVRLAAPKMALVAVNCENSPYVSYCGNLKNCHLLCGSEFDQDCYYGFWLYDSEDCTDCDYCQKCRLCYDCVDCIDCYNVNHSQDCVNCTDCDYCFDCAGCKNCFGCTGLRRKQYMIGNKQYSKEEYFEKVKQLKNTLSTEEMKEMLEDVKKKVPHLYVHQLNNENFTGDYVYNSRNALRCFDVKELEDCMYCNNAVSLKDCMDMSNSYYNSELNYEVMAEMNLTNCNFCVTCFDNHDLDHCELVYNSHDCFGCFSLNHAEYRIFNEQYAKDEYSKKVAQIKEEMLKSGEYMQFLPSTYPFEDSNATMELSEKPAFIK